MASPSLAQLSSEQRHKGGTVYYFVRKLEGDYFYRVHLNKCELISL